jgi:DNA-binding response OmpR family regulator
MAKILLIEDDSVLASTVCDWLTAERHNVDRAGDGADGLEKLRFYKYDLVILDWMLEHLSGIEILQEMRRLSIFTPVLMLTGRDSLNDKETGLDAGADDYLTKPFHMKELSARLRALLRRPPNLVELAQFGDLVVDQGTHKVTKGGLELKLLPTEFALLEFLLRHPNQVFSQEALLDRVWPSQSDATSYALTSCIKRLRRKLDDKNQESIIKTVYGVGYKLELPQKEQSPRE